jgi:zinc transport system permease protein
MGILDAEFMRLALAAGIVVGAVAPAVGFFLVQRQLSLIGDGIGHIAFAGVALGYLVGVDPVVTALVASVGGAVGIERLRGMRETVGDQALALFFYGGIAAGVVMISSAGALNANLFSFLFGSILTVEPGDVVLVAVLGVVALGVVVFLYRGLVAVAVDEEAARASGLPVTAINVALAALAGLVVAISMRIVGILLIAALMALPVMTAARIARSLRSALLLAIAIGILAAVGGLVAAYYLDLAAGGAIVLLAALIFVARLAWEAMAPRGAGAEAPPS